MSDLLFLSKGRLVDYLGNMRLNFEEEIDKLDVDYLLQVSEYDLIEFFADKYKIDRINLSVDQKYQLEPKDVNIDVSGDRSRARFRSQPFYIKGTEIKICIPYTGNRDLFHYQASTFSYNPPRGDVTENEVILTYQVPQSYDRLRDDINSDVDSINQHLGWTNRDVDSFNDQLHALIQKTLAKRKQKVMNDRDLSINLGIPVKQRNNAPKTYSPPEIRHKPHIQRPAVKTTQPFTPEPALSDQEYENILRILKNMVLVIERSPKAFSRMSEEDLRQHFLVQLNGQYEGTATGETFNYSGKTDILIRIEGKNVFIAECKIWRGADHFSETIDQLLAYTSWRDTKTAILIFNRNRNSSDVLSKIPSVVEQHGCFKRHVRMDDETTFRYVFTQPNDPNRELYLTVMAFDVPK